jgi:hypothetical protein
MTLDMFKPFKACNVVEFTLRPHGDATSVTWAMDGPRPIKAARNGQERRL